MDHSAHDHDHEMMMSGGGNAAGAASGNPGDSMSATMMHHDSKMPPMAMMPMTFFFGTHGKILFDGWNPQSTSAFAGACFAWFLIAFAYELLKVIREIVHDRTRKVHCCPEKHASGLDSPPLPTSREWFYAMVSPAHVLDTLIYAFQFIIAYLLMLAVMTYNAWLFIAITCGAVIGHFLFGWRKRSTREGHCF